MKRSFIIAKGDLRIITPVFGRGLCVSCPLDPPHLFRTVFLRIFYALELGVAFQYPVVLVYYNTDQYYSILAVMNGCGVDPVRSRPAKGTATAVSGRPASKRG